MKKYNLLPISESVTNEIRSSMKDQLGHQLKVTIAQAGQYGPCRSCLKQFQIGDKRILFSYVANRVDNPYNEIGPVYIHAEKCQQYSQTDQFPEEIKNGPIAIPLAIRCYNSKGILIDGVTVNDRDVEAVIADLFGNEKIAYLQLRNAEVGCYIAHIDRA